MADDRGFSNEPRLPGIKEPKSPRPARRVPKAVGPTPLATPLPPSIAAPPARASETPWESDVSPARVVTPLPPEAYTTGPPPTSAPSFDWFARVPLFIGIAGLPIYAIVYGIRTLGAARRGAPVNKAGAVVALALGGAVILGVVGVAAAIILEPGEGRDPLDLAVGECVTDKGFTSESPHDVPSVRVIACEEPHFGQVFHASTLAAGAYPGEAAVINSVEKACSAQADRVYLDASDPDAYLNFLFPSRDLWFEGDRSYMCFVTASGEERFVGSVLTP